VLAGLDSVSLKTIRRFAMRSKRWMLAYINKLTEDLQRSSISHIAGVCLSNMYNISHPYFVFS